MDNIKASLTISLPGRLVFSRQECLKNPKSSSIYSPCSRVTNLTKEAYDYLTSKEARVSSVPTKEWNKMSKYARLKAHCEIMAKDQQGEFVNVQVFED